MIKKRIFLASLLCLLTVGCAATPIAEKPAHTVTLLSPGANETVDTSHPDVTAFMTDYTRRTSAEAQYGKGDHFAPRKTTLSWTCDTSAETYTVEFATNESFTDARTVTTDATETTVTNLYTGTQYYWRVTAQTSDGAYTSDTGTFFTAAAPRTISLDGVSNIRDIGTLRTKDGGTLRQGLVYRSATLDNITFIGKNEQTESLRIKTQLDLRKDGEGTAGKGSVLGSDVNYIHLSAPYYYNGTTGLSDKNNYATFAAELRVFTDPDNFPVLFHCSVGRDRTGTLAFVLEILCGVTEEDLFKDYEMSFLSASGCLDGASVDTMYKQITPLYDFLQSYSDGDLYENTEAFVREKIGLTQDEIEAIRRNLVVS